MRLLTKSEIEQSRAKERKLEIDEGMKLARHVDKLRKTVADEQKSLGEFATANTKELIGQIADKADELRALTLEVNDLREERAELRKPLDDEWEAVARVRLELAGKAVTLGTKALALDVREETVEQKEEASCSLEKRAHETSAEAAELMAAARKRERDADTHLFKVNAIVEARENEQVLRQRRLDAREAAIASRERDTKNKSKNLDARARALELEERRVLDLYQTYLRNQERGKRSKG